VVRVVFYLWFLYLSNILFHLMLMLGLERVSCLVIWGL
jgi:hypothetical protein